MAVNSLNTPDPYAYNVTIISTIFRNNYDGGTPLCNIYIWRDNNEGATPCPLPGTAADAYSGGIRCCVNGDLTNFTYMIPLDS